jgi:hypothetical protein
MPTARLVEEELKMRASLTHYDVNGAQQANILKGS